MLTVKEINEVSFGKAGFSGYKPEDVDNFIDEVVASFQQLEAERDDSLKRASDLAAQNAQLTAQNAEIKEKLAILAKEIESYRADEDGIKEALLSAQRVAKDSVQEAKDKAALIMHDAQESAKEILANAKLEASKAADEYSTQTEEKKEEFEELKRQVTAFRSNLLDMYKKHLESINQIPNFRVKKKTEESEAPAQQKPEEPQPAPVEEPAPQAPVTEPVAEPRKTEPVRSAPQPVQSQQPRRKPAPEKREQPTLNDRVDFTKNVAQEDDFADEDLTSVGIDIKSYSSIPESLKREKNSHFSNLEFGDDVDLGNKKRKK